jgi:hypothetical protein
MLGVAILVSAVRYAQTRSQARSWRGLAERTGLSYRRGWWLEFTSSRVFGPYRGRQVELRTEPEHLFDYIFDETRLIVRLHKRTDAFPRLHRGALGGKVVSWFPRRSDIRTGDPQFDQSFIIASRPPGLVSTALASQTLRDRLLRVRDATTIELLEDRVTLVRSGIERDGTHLHFLLDLMVDLAEALEQSLG